MHCAVICMFIFFLLICYDSIMVVDNRDYVYFGLEGFIVYVNAFL